MTDSRSAFGELSRAAVALGAAGAWMSLRIQDRDPAPEIAAALAKVLEASGLGGLTALSPGDLTPLLGEVRITLTQALQLIDEAESVPTWNHIEQRHLESQGDASAGFAGLLRRGLIPHLSGLGASLEREGAAFLDVGTGVGALAIGVAHEFPSVHVTGLDIWQPSLDIAARRIQAAGLDDRITLRCESVEDLADSAVYDASFLAGPFLPPSVREKALPKLRMALRPGGWLLFGYVNSGKDELSAATAQVRTLLWGGRALGAESAERELLAAGFTDVWTLAAPDWSMMGIVAGRRPLE